jgi:hypothetical protein
MAVILVLEPENRPKFQYSFAGFSWNSVAFTAPVSYSNLEAGEKNPKFKVWLGAPHGNADSWNGGLNVKKSLILISMVMLIALVASAANVTYNTTGSTLSCNGVAGCTNPTTTSVTVGGITITYNSATEVAPGVATPSITSLGTLVSSGTGTNVAFSGIVLTIDVTDTSLGKSGTLPTGLFSGVISTNSSELLVLFSPNNTTSIFGTLPGVALTSGLTTDTFQVLNATEGVEDPSDPLASPGSTSLQGDVTESIASATPEPITLGTLGFGLIGLGLLKRKRSVR